MTQLKPSIFVNRVYVSKNSKPAFDEFFHRGLNIIRGQNSSGKTSIMNLIAFGLGRDVKNWKREALSCDFILIQVEINESLLTLKREIDSAQQRPLYIFAGALNEALEAGPQQWSKYPYNSTSEKESFSDALFKVMDMPRPRAERSKITMHQIMRLCYADQPTPPTHIFNVESFDSALTREAVFSLLTGLYNDELYKSQTELDFNQKRLEKADSEIRSIIKILAKSEITDTTNDILDSKINRSTSEEFEIIAEIERVLNEKNEEDKGPISKEADRKFEELALLREQVFDLDNKISSLRIKTQDSELFINSLNKKKSALNDSMKLRENFSNFQFQFCPACFTPVETSSLDDSCHLCKHPIEEETIKNNFLRMGQEINFQILESTKINEKRISKIDELNNLKSIQFQSVRELEQDLAMLQKTVFKESDTVLKDLYIRLGKERETIRELLSKSKLVQEIENLRDERDSAQRVVNDLKERVSEEYEKIESRKQKVVFEISENTLEVLHSDLGRQKEFGKGGEVIFSPSENVVYLDGKNDFSDSSQFYLKNAFHIAMLMSSLEDKEFMFPRFIMLDGIENGGMEDIRSQRFQEYLSAFSERAEVDHQIIITTAKISTHLNNDKYTVGRYYTEEEKSIEL